MAYKSGFHADSYQFMFRVYAGVSSAVAKVAKVAKDKVRVNKDIQDNSAIFLFVRAPKIVQEN